MKNIVFQRTVDVHCWRVIGQVSKATQREELMPVLLRAQEQGFTTDSDISEHLLFEPRSRLVVARRLLGILVCYGLLEEEKEDGKDKKDKKRFVLTAAGRIAIQTKQMFVPEYGAWTVWISEDPLLPCTVLRVEPWNEPPAREETRTDSKDDADARLKRFSSIPSWVLTPCQVLLPGEHKEQLRIDQLEAKGEPIDSGAALRIVWDVTGGRLRLEGTLNGPPVETVLDAPSINATEVWQQLLDSEGLRPRWDETHAALRTDFDETSPSERESMSRAIEFRQPVIADLGRFETMTVSNVPLLARDAANAVKWAEWRLRENIRDYATAERFAEWVKKAIKPFAEFKLEMPSRKDLAVTAWENRSTEEWSPETAWHLISAEDWRL